MRAILRNVFPFLYETVTAARAERQRAGRRETLSQHCFTNPNDPSSARAGQLFQEPRELA
jgi:hypothetical protein